MAECVPSSIIHILERKYECALFQVEVLLQGVDVGFEGVAAGGGDAAGGTGTFAFVALGDGYVAGAAQLVELDAEVAGGRLRLGAQIDEVGLLDVHQYRHYRQPELRMQ